ncbi:DegT/DnrJ/EryC1/StrS family aminotransferase [Clostridium scatologenes]|uniref:Putative uridine 5'-(Beta-1-threo-pentapyranosyl-4-ulose diphosphate) aminotransferase, PLP-dependent n=1 Tax=Clostridium scatologenes TaxID=1548 RepID=A0A0E3MBL6_CLOSL|nr:DegT/DnrJ/EryC1/StrS family aminotransferase [Clostridium scatologenes]AKA71840.1 putative uridine 5'-(beta-1-threo-pentapyranosyl-4-ulose diphosphate) aminotransferase, PLP-dependent [Clostridium scatologenes]
MKVRLFKPSLGDEEIQSIKDAFDMAWLGLGPKTREFEKQWTNYIGCKESVGVNSCTAALHLAVSAFRFPKGKKVLVPVLTFASTAMAPIYNGLEPVFVDVDEDTLTISLEDLERKCDKDCVAVMPVHYGGYPAKIDEIMNFAKSKNLKVIEDCAHTAGGEYKGKILGTWGDIGCYSFEEKKCMTTGDGGMICSNDRELISPLKSSRWVGMNKDTWQREKENSISKSNSHWYYEILELGYKYNMNDLMASIGLVQLKKLPEMNKRRMEIIAKYLDGIKDCSSLKPALPYDKNQKCYWMFMLRVKNRDKFISFMQQKDIATGVHYMPLTLHPYFAKYENNTPKAISIWKEFVTIPLHADMTNEEVDYVIENVKAFDLLE